MARPRPYALVSLNWLKLTPPLQHPRGRRFAPTGYLEHEGIENLFSLWVVLTEDVIPESIQEARIFALVPSLDERLPRPGETLIITAGRTPVAIAKAISKGEGVV